MATRARLAAKVQLFDIILFALLAAYVILRLGRVLGRRPGNGGRTPMSNMFRNAADRDDNVVVLPEANRPSPANADLSDEGGDEEPDPEVAANAGLAEIRSQDPAFDPRQFLSGARAAYDMVVTGFAAADRETLRRLLTREVFENFARAIEEREERGETLETTVIGLDSAELVDARVAESMAQVTVKFVSQLINVVRDRDGNAISGDGAAKQVVDVWTFVRDTHSSDPNWALAETRSPT